MRTPRSLRGYRQSLLRRLSGFTSFADLTAFVSSDAYAETLRMLPPKDRSEIMRGFGRAWQRCEKAQGALPAPWERKRASWKDPAFVARFRHVYAESGGIPERARLEIVARKLAITVGAARIARNRYARAAATQDYAKAA